MPDSRFPFTPFPRGWFFFELSKNMPVGKLIGREWLGESVVGWRGNDGKVVRCQRVPPHLGAKLDPRTGGSIKDGNLVCPFHGFTYDVSGACVSTATTTRRALLPIGGCRVWRRRVGRGR